MPVFSLGSCLISQCTLQIYIQFDDFKCYFSESGPMCVSPTGQIIAPSTCPGTILVEFLTNHMNEAAEKSEAYRK